jgi:hypothetical protein
LAGAGGGAGGLATGLSSGSSVTGLLTGLSAGRSPESFENGHEAADFEVELDGAGFEGSVLKGDWAPDDDDGFETGLDGADGAGGFDGCDEERDGFCGSIHCLLSKIIPQPGQTSELPMIVPQRVQVLTSLLALV